MKKNFLKISTITFLIVVALFVAGLPSAAKKPKPVRPVKNVILLIGDGMGPYHVNLTKLCLGGSELAMEEMDETGPSYVTTYALDYDDRTTHVITDSAAAGTAIATGYKTYKRAISVDFDGNELETVLERAEAEGKSTGVITDVWIEDATPAVFATHVVSRGMYMEIAEQLAYSDVEVLMGAGKGAFLPKGGDGGQRTDGRNLIDEMENMGYTYVDSAKELENADINLDDGEKLLGFFGGYSAMAYDLDRQHDEDACMQPTLAEMTEKAIEVLSQDPDGFFLMVEGGGIDWVAHKRDVAGVVRETEALDEAVDVAWDFAEGDGETLVVVTADHETGGLQITSESIYDEPPTGVPIDPENVNVDFIMGITATIEYIWGEIRQGADLEATVLTYTGYDLSPAELDLISDAEEEHPNSGARIIADLLNAEAGVVWGFTGMKTGTHTFLPVPIYAYGPNAEQFDDVTDNTEFGQELFIAVSGYWH